jgi:hypothetical protein
LLLKSPSLIIREPMRRKKKYIDHTLSDVIAKYHGSQELFRIQTRNGNR